MFYSTPADAVHILSKREHNIKEIGTPVTERTSMSPPQLPHIHRALPPNQFYMCTFGCGGKAGKFQTKGAWTDHELTHRHSWVCHYPDCGKEYKHYGSYFNHVTTRSHFFDGDCVDHYIYNRNGDAPILREATRRGETRKRKRGRDDSDDEEEREAMSRPAYATTVAMRRQRMIEMAHSARNEDEPPRRRRRQSTPIEILPRRFIKSEKERRSSPEFLFATPVSNTTRISDTPDYQRSVDKENRISQLDRFGFERLDSVEDYERKGLELKLRKAKLAKEAAEIEMEEIQMKIAERKKGRGV